MAHHQRLAGNPLQGLHGFRQPLGHGVDLVDEDDVRDVARIEEAQDRRQHDGARRVRFADHNRDVRDHGAVHRLLQEFDRAGAVQHRPVVAQIVEARRQDLRAHVPVARFRRGVADRVAVPDAALARQCPGGVQHGFHQARLAAEIRAHKGHASRVRAHRPSPCPAVPSAGAQCFHAVTRSATKKAMCASLTASRRRARCGAMQRKEAAS